MGGSFRGVFHFRVGPYSTTILFDSNQAKLIVRFTFPPACFSVDAINFSLYGKNSFIVIVWKVCKQFS